MERCKLLEEERGRVEIEERCTWKERHVHRMTKKKGPVGPEKEEEEDKLERFFSSIYAFHNPVPASVPAVFVPAELPPRYAIDFVPAMPVLTPVPAPAPISAPASCVLSTDYSVISSVNFAVPVSASVPTASPHSTDYSVVFSLNFHVTPPVIVSPTCIDNT